MSILPDPIQMALNMVPFAVAIVGMYFIILKPMIAYLEEREQAIRGGREEAEEIEARITEKMETYEAEVQSARAEVAALRMDQRAVAQAAYDEVIAAARAKADGQINEALVEIKATREAVAETLKSSSADLALQVAGRVLGREVAAR
jgi:F-type H+-transporting ATPase subunit b